MVSFRGKRPGSFCPIAGAILERLARRAPSTDAPGTG